MPGHYLSVCKDCLKAHSGNGKLLPKQESRVETENLAIQRLKQQGIWAQTGKSSNAPDVDVTAMGLVWIEVKKARLELHRTTDTFKFNTTPKQIKRGFLADIVMLICEWKTGRLTYHLFRFDDPIFYTDGHVKTAFTYVPTRKNRTMQAGKRTSITSATMSAAQDNWGLIDTVYRELSARLPTEPFPHRRWRE